jgi:hypothetical protein
MQKKKFEFKNENLAVSMIASIVAMQIIKRMGDANLIDLLFHDSSMTLSC